MKRVCNIAMEVHTVAIFLPIPLTLLLDNTQRDTIHV